MNGQLGNVPVTTLAGISSLSELLPQLPLPTAVTTHSREKTLLFHQRIGEESQKQLSSSGDEQVNQQLIQALALTSSDAIQLKDGTEGAVHDPGRPELLKTLLKSFPTVFAGPNQGGVNAQIQTSMVQPSYQMMQRGTPSRNSIQPMVQSQTRSMYAHPISGALPPHIANQLPLVSPPTPLTIGHQSPSHYPLMQQVSPYAPIQSPGPSPLTPGSVTLSVGTPQQSPMSQTPIHPSQTPTFPVQINEQISHKYPPIVNPSSVGSPVQVVQNNVKMQNTKCQEVNVNKMDGHVSQSQTLTTVNEPPVEQVLPQPPSVECNSKIHVNAEVNKENKVEEVQKPVVYSSSEQTPILNGTKTPDKGPQEKDQKTKLKRTKDKSHEKNADSVCVGSILVEENLIKKSDKVVVDGDKVVKIVENEKCSVKSVNIDNGIKIPKGFKDIGMMKPMIKLSKLSPEDEKLMQKSLKEFAAKDPEKALKYGIKFDSPKYHRTSIKGREDLERDKSESKFFKSKDKGREEERKRREREKDKSREKDREERKRRREESVESSPQKRHKKSLDEKDDHSEDESLSVRKRMRKSREAPALAEQALTSEELMETGTFQKFSRALDAVFESMEDIDFKAMKEDDAQVPAEALLSKSQLTDLCSEAAKLKSMNATHVVSSGRLVKLMTILERNIRDGCKISPIADPDEDEDERQLWADLAFERIHRAADASLTCLYIMTSSKMSKKVYQEECIDRIISFAKWQITNTIFPSYDPVYAEERKTKESFLGSAKKKRAHAREVRDKSVIVLYNKSCDIVVMLSELLNIQTLTDTAVLQLSVMGVAPFFVENVSELQLAALRLVTTLFSRYEMHRRLVLDDILASIARLPSSKRSLRTFRVSPDENVQMLTALVLQLIQCVVVLPDWLAPKGDSEKKKDEESEPRGKSKMDKESYICKKCEMAIATAANFLSAFLGKCASKGEEIDYRPLFENFVQDLLVTVNKPEWPSSELLLSLLGQLLVNNFVTKTVEMSLRVASLDYLGVVAAKLRKDAVTSHKKNDLIDDIIKDAITDWEESENDVLKYLKEGTTELEKEERKTEILECLLLDYLAVGFKDDPALLNARQFYLAQWYKDAALEVTCSIIMNGQLKPQPSDLQQTPKKEKKEKRRKKKKRKGSSDEEDSESDESEGEKNLRSESRTQNVSGQSAIDQAGPEVTLLVNHRRRFLLTKIILPKKCRTILDSDSAFIVAKYLASKRPFSMSFERYLKRIVQALFENAIAIRTKAMKCLSQIVECDASVLALEDMQLGVKKSISDTSTQVREAAVDLLGKFVVSRPDLIDAYYETISQRILDCGVSVRKRVIKILKDICIETPDFPKIPEMCVKMIRRVNDEEIAVKKLVMETFHNLWFTPVKEKPSLDIESLQRKVSNITDVVAASQDVGTEFFESLLDSLFKPKEDKEDSTKVATEPSKSLLTASTQIVDCLVDHVLRLEGCRDNQNADESQSRGSSVRLVACLRTLYMFAKIRPSLVVKHGITLQPYLSIRCQTQGDQLVVGAVAKTLALIIPLMEHPSESFLSQLESDCIKIICLHGPDMATPCMKCLDSVTNRLTKNYKLIQDLFRRCYAKLNDFKAFYESRIDDQSLISQKPSFRRALFIIGLIVQHFDLTKPEVRGDLTPEIKDEVLEKLMFFLSLEDADVQLYTLQAFGTVCLRHADVMMTSQFSRIYLYFLDSPLAPLILKRQALHNIQNYLEEEEAKLIRQDQEWNSSSNKQDDLKEMCDVSSGMASSVIQLYLKSVLNCFIHIHPTIRFGAFKVVQLVLQQGLVHPVQIVPYLICLGTEKEQVLAHAADKQLQDIDKKYQGFVHMKALQGIRLSYELQKVIQKHTPLQVPPPKGLKADLSKITRGYRPKEGELPSALCGYLYSIVRQTKTQRRAIAQSLLKQFEENSRVPLEQLLYLADNFAYFPYVVADEPLFVIHHIDIIVSVNGSNLLQSFRESLLPSSHHPDIIDPLDEDDDEGDDVDSLIELIPPDPTPLLDCINSSRGCLLLLCLKQFLKESFSVTDAKLNQYLPSEPGKVYERAVTRKSVSLFNPKITLQALTRERPGSELDPIEKRALIEEYLEFKQLMLRIDPDDIDDDEDPSFAQTPVKKERGIPPSVTPITPMKTDPATPLKAEPAEPTDQSTAATPVKAGETPVKAKVSLNDNSSITKIPKITISLGSKSTRVESEKETRRESDRSRERDRHHKSKRHDRHDKKEKSDYSERSERKHKKKKKKKKYVSDSEGSDRDSDPDFMG
ncbi:nipped-B-like protein B isoform X2 [Artemia franciscana]|uniref:nipped-B-like protein B isoform X2 n=1 Tax=Artemia franciscana TaxID=6661 RepID=UPI0032DA14A6